jgi:molybdate transport system ATP-binding protein
MVGLASAMSVTASIRKRLSAGFSLDVDLSAAPGITMIFGASGSGKTTLLNCLAGLIRPDGGCITIGPQVLFDSTTSKSIPAQKRRVGYVFQQLALFPHMSAADNIEYGLALHIAHLLARRPSAISGGERQRVALARSLVTDPLLLLLDEPLAALDHLTQSRIIADLRAWNEAHHIPIFYVTHSHREVFAL